MSISSLRTSVALTRCSHVAAASVTGPGRFELLDRVSTRELLIHDSEILPSLFLDADGTIQADIEICRSSEALLVLAEGMTPDHLVRFLADHRPPGIAAEIGNLSDSRTILALNGPYAWELLSQLAGPGILGQPYLTFFSDDRWTCLRSGKTGEVGYSLMLPSERAAEVTDRILDLGARFDITCVEVDELDGGYLENGALCMRARGITAYNPIELQQQWRVSYGKEFVGASALRARRQGDGSEQHRRSVYLASAAELVPDSRVFCHQDEVGRILQTAYSAVRRQWVASAMVERRFAYPGLTVLHVDGPDSRADVTTITAPMINNRSLYVNPRLHSYFTRDEVEFPPLDMDASWLVSGRQAGVEDGD